MIPPLDLRNGEVKVEAYHQGYLQIKHNRKWANTNKQDPEEFPLSHAPGPLDYVEE